MYFTGTQYSCLIFEVKSYFAVLPYRRAI